MLYLKFLIIVLIRGNKALSIKKRISDVVDNVVNKYFEAKNDHFVSQQHCIEAGVKCNSCLSCFPGGWCLIDEFGVVSSQCICNYGWTGKGAFYKQDTSSPDWGRNRIIAYDCLKACHYTHHVRNPECGNVDGEITTTKIPHLNTTIPLPATTKASTPFRNTTHIPITTTSTTETTITSPPKITTTTPPITTTTTPATTTTTPPQTTTTPPQTTTTITTPTSTTTTKSSTATTTLHPPVTTTTKSPPVKTTTTIKPTNGIDISDEVAPFIPPAIALPDGRILKDNIMEDILENEIIEDVIDEVLNKYLE